MAFPYKCVLVTGATSGIGLALTERIISQSSFVIATGRRKERLDELFERFGADKIAVEEFDVSAIDKLEAWVAHLTEKFPKLDAILLNAGFQHHPVFLDPSSLSLPTIEEELRTNYLSPLQTTLLFLSHLQNLSRSQPAAIILVTSGLALVPALTVPTYSATKAALHSFAWTLRATLAEDFPNLKVQEIIPPAVKTELHIKQGAPEIGMPLDTFADQTWSGMISGQDELTVGMVAERFARVEDERKKEFANLCAIMKPPRPTAK
ncbi:short chain dehydrogenase [Fusarium oxysporum f. sp. albedinis]|nr:short chain dehydrogenase [Fusarium oxysporum f. sp. albedinis]KAJ0135310.1 hypothetical protein HZ326_21649 [Fusarium oxysporum f. sp. albedinis]KAJ0136190.1 Uncharacterized protein HZ326_20818 [Fusarium oxysporum f. sp. albedinis]KAK2471226.1 hypothetical protein H9L39_17457 [Fusarium oxysporum f. sp. albedinis]